MQTQLKSYPSFKSIVKVNKEYSYFNPDNSGVRLKVSPREMEILKLMSEGFTSREIGSKLYISRLTVDKHKRNLIVRFGVRNSVHLVYVATKKKYLQDDYILEC